MRAFTLLRQESKITIDTVYAVYDEAQHGITNASCINDDEGHTIDQTKLSRYYTGINGTRYSSKTAPTEAGSYKVTTTFVGDAIHEMKVSVQRFEIAQRSVKIIPHDAFKTEGTVDPQFTFKIVDNTMMPMALIPDANNVIYDSSIDPTNEKNTWFEVTRQPGEAAGTYTISVKATANADTKNFLIEGIDSEDGVIGKATFTINAAPKTPIYDDGGPFTTDKCGNTYDRWGNVMYKAEGCSTGYKVPNTALN